MDKITNQIKVSVVIPVYNVELYVEKAVRSIMSQTLKEIEIIVVNDGSTDSSLNIVRKLANEDSRIQIISNPNHGLSVARNLGIYRAIGEYIYFFDSDDWLEPNALELSYNKCQENKLDFLFFDAIIFSDECALEDVEQMNYERTKLYEDRVYSGAEILEKQFSTHGYSSSACLSFIRRSYLSDIKLNFYPYLLHEDELFTCLLYINASRVGFISQAFFHRRVRVNSIMQVSFTMKNAANYLDVCRELHIYRRRYDIEKNKKLLVKRRIGDILLGMLAKSYKNLSSKEFCVIKKCIYFEFKKYIDWKILLLLSFPSLFFYLLKLKQNKI